MRSYASTEYKILSFEAVRHVQTNQNAGDVRFTIKRGLEEFERTLRAESCFLPTNMPSFGILSWQGNTNVTLAHPGPWEQIEASASQIFATVGAVFSKKNDIGVQQLGGAVMIIRVYKIF
ncbi:MAG: hypothetical protein U1F83_13285 [Verrucomicrobiota bacterium]